MDSVGYGAALSLDPAENCQPVLDTLDLFEITPPPLADEGPDDFAIQPWPFFDPPPAERAFALDDSHHDATTTTGPFPSFTDLFPDEDTTIHTADGVEGLIASVFHDSTQPIIEDGASDAPRITKTRASRKRRLTDGYPCTFRGCAVKYDTAGDLAKHIQRHHTPHEQWRFECEVCGKRSYDKRDHTRHMNVERKRAALALRDLVPAATTSAVASSSRAEASPPPEERDMVLASPASLVRPPHEEEATTGRSSSSAISPVLFATTTAPSPPLLGHYHANYTHPSTTHAFAAAVADLERFASLPTVQITIEAILPMGPGREEAMTLAATHRIQQQQQNQGTSCSPIAPGSGCATAGIDSTSGARVGAERDPKRSNCSVVTTTTTTKPLVVSHRSPSRVCWAIGLLTSTAGADASGFPNIGRSRSVNLVPSLTRGAAARPRMRPSSTSLDSSCFAVGQTPCRLEFRSKRTERSRTGMIVC